MSLVAHLIFSGRKTARMRDQRSEEGVKVFALISLRGALRQEKLEKEQKGERK